MESIEFPADDRKLLNHVLMAINEIVQGQPVPHESEFYKHEMFNRIFRHYLTSCQVEKGVELSFRGKTATVKDYAALAVIFRSVVETLTLFYLIYIEDSTPEEVDFRYKCWRRQGLVTRQRFRSVPEDQRTKLRDEETILEKLESEIRTNPRFARFTSNQQVKFKNLGTWNFETETELLVKIGFNKFDCQNTYPYLSSHAHVESSGLMQVWQMDQEGLSPRFMTLLQSQIILFVFSFVSLYLDSQPAVSLLLDSNLVDRVHFWRNQTKG